MISIYLCDDEECVRHQLKTVLEWKILRENYDMSVVCAVSAVPNRKGRIEEEMERELLRFPLCFCRSGTIFAVQEDLPTAGLHCGMLLSAGRQKPK